MQKYSFIDALRGIAVILVVIVHFGQGLPGSWHLVWFSQFGQYGVQLFFALSAYTLYNSLSRKPEFTAADYRDFMARRFLRIAPLYYLGILVYFFYNTAARYSSDAVLANVFFVHGLYAPGNNNIVPGGWSIGCEFLFYAILPALLFSRVGRLKIIGAFSFVLFSATCVLALFGEKMGLLRDFGIPNNGFLYFNLINQFPCFAMGIVCFHLQDNVKFKAFIHFITPVCCLLLVYCHGWHWGPLFTPLLAGTISVSLILSLRNLRTPSLLQKFGQCSFSIYIWHFLFLGILKDRFWHLMAPGRTAEVFAMALLALLLMATYCISTLSNKYIELPFIRLGEALFKTKVSIPSPDLGVKRPDEIEGRRAHESV